MIPITVSERVEWRLLGLCVGCGEEWLPCCCYSTGRLRTAYEAARNNGLCSKCASRVVRGMFKDIA